MQESIKKLKQFEQTLVPGIVYTDKLKIPVKQ